MTSSHVLAALVMVGNDKSALGQTSVGLVNVDLHVR